MRACQAELGDRGTIALVDGREAETTVAVLATSPGITLPIQP